MGRLDAARTKVSLAEQIEKATRLEAGAATTNARTNLNARTVEYRIMKEAEEKASKAIDLAGKRYAQGTLPLFDYSRSIENWTTVRQEVIEAQRRVAEAQEQLDFERGAL